MSLIMVLAAIGLVSWGAVEGFKAAGARLASGANDPRLGLLAGIQVIGGIATAILSFYAGIWSVGLLVLSAFDNGGPLLLVFSAVAALVTGVSVYYVGRLFAGAGRIAHAVWTHK